MTFFTLIKSLALCKAKLVTNFETELMGFIDIYKNIILKNT